MRWYQIVACILLILSVFGFVLAAPVAVQQAREARADVVDGGENVIIGSRKRAPADEEPLLQSWQQAQGESSSYWTTTPWRQQGTSSAPNYGTRPNPSFSPGDSKPPPLSTSGEAEVPWNPQAEGGAKLTQPGASTEIQPASLSKAKSVSWAPTKKVVLPTGEVYTDMLQPETKPPQLSITGGTELSSKPEGEAKSIRPGVSTEIQPASSSNVKWPDIRPPLSGEEVYRPEIAEQQSLLPPKPKSKNMFKKLVSKFKLNKLKLPRRIFGTAGGIVTEGQRDLQGTVDT